MSTFYAQVLKIYRDKTVHFVHSPTYDDFKGQDTVLKETRTTKQQAR